MSYGDETPDLRWFEAHSVCRICHKKSDGILRDHRNQSYGEHCKKCAEKRLAASKKVREREAKIAASERDMS